MTNTELNTIKVNSIQWSGRAEAALKNGGLIDKTLGDLENMKDDELLSVSRLGRGSLGEIRQKTTQAAAKIREDKLRASMERSRAKANPVVETKVEPITAPAAVSVAPEPQSPKTRPMVEETPSPAMAFAKSHPSIIEAIIKGEMILVPKL